MIVEQEVVVLETESSKELEPGKIFTVVDSFIGSGQIGRWITLKLQTGTERVETYVQMNPAIPEWKAGAVFTVIKLEPGEALTLRATISLVLN